MYSYIIRRSLLTIPTLFIISVISFAVIQAPPGDFLDSELENLRQQYGADADMMIAQLRSRYGLDQQLHIQYFTWIKGIITRGDFGQSLDENRPVSDILIARVPVSILLITVTLLFTWIVAVPIGIYSAVKQYSVFDYSFTLISFVGISIPNFLLALVLMYFLYANFGWSLGGLVSKQFVGAPLSFAKILDYAKNMIVPVLVIGAVGMAEVVRVLRGMILDELGKAYVQTARAKGLSNRVVVWKHVLKIAILPLVSTIGWLLPQMVGREMIAAIVLNLPTTGTALFRALRSQDMYVAGSIMLILSTYVVFGTLLSDILLAFFDPRIRYD
jgi:peptide/nickel transport system permease protein